MDEKFSDKVLSVAGSILFHAILLIILIIFGLNSIPQEEEGILVNFGDSPTGLGASEPVRNMPTATQQQPTPPPTSPPPVSPPKAVQQPKVNENLTQNIEQTAALEAEKKRQQEAENKRLEAERKAKEEAERVRKEQERREAEERARLAEEQRKREEQQRQADAIRSKTAGAFSKTDGTGASEGVTQGPGNQGVPIGDPSSTNREGTGLGKTGVSFSLSGRSVSGVLPNPVYTTQESGVVVVEIKVDKNGTVTEAKPILAGSTTQDKVLQAAATRAALKSKFNSDPGAAAYQVGTITYRFVLE